MTFRISQRGKEYLQKATVVLVCAFVLSSTFALAHPIRHKSGISTHQVYRGDARLGSGMLHPSYGNPNGNEDGPTTLRRTGSSSFGGSSRGTSCYENCALRDTPHDDWPADMVLD